jgi:lipoyl(octanoyl) transferase
MKVFVEPAGRPGPENMAIDESLLVEAARSGRAFLRLYRWSPPCLSFGRNEPALATYDARAIERLGLAVVRRPTGGRAVWHDDEVTYAVAAPIASFGRLRAAYRAIHERLAAALRALGVNATLASETGRESFRALDRPGPCFAASVGGEVVVGGRKVIGSAQVRQGSALLQHGSILLDGSQDVIHAVSYQPSAVRHATTVAEALGRRVAFDEIAEAIVRTWGGNVTSPALYRPLPSSTVRFSDPGWTWRR